MVKTKSEYQREFTDQKNIDEAIELLKPKGHITGAYSILLSVISKNLRKGPYAFISKKDGIKISVQAADAAELESTKMCNKYMADYETPIMTSSFVTPMFKILLELFYLKRIAEELYIDARMKQDKILELEEKLKQYTQPPPIKRRWASHKHN